MVGDSVCELETKACAVVMATGYLVLGIYADTPCEGFAVDLRIASVLHGEIDKMVPIVDEKVIW